MALWIGLQFNCSLHLEPRPLLRLLEEDWNGRPLDARFQPCDREQVLTAVRAGEKRVLQLAGPGAGADRFQLSVDCTPLHHLTAEAEARPCPFWLTLCIGSAHVGAIGHRAIVQTVVRFAEQVDVGQGVIAVGGDDTVWDTGREWQPTGPGWGNFLSPEHVAQYGGSAALDRGPWQVKHLCCGGGAYVQLTPSPDGMATRAGKSVLARFTKPHG